MADFNNREELSKDMPYDLRQKYAQLVGDHLDDVTKSRKLNNFPLYYESLHDLFIITQHKFQNKKVKIKEKKDGKIEEKDVNAIIHYYYLVGKASAIFKKYPMVFIGQSSDMTGLMEIKGILNHIEMFLWNLIEESKILGDSKFIPGL